MSKVRLAIIGNGMVGHRFIEDLLDKSDASLFDITVFCENPVKPMTVSTCHPTSLTTPRKSSLWCVKDFTRSTA